MMPSVKTNPYLESVREAYRNSALYRSLHGGEPVEKTASAVLPKVEYREDMPVEDYERYIEELTQP